MSAFLVNDKHIDALLTWAVRPRWQAPSHYQHNENKVIFYDNLEVIGQELVNENHKSLTDKYHDPYHSHEYKFTPYLNPLSPVQIIKACDCYNYQACETGEDYWKSEAHEIIDTIRERAIDELPGMDDAAWEIR